MLPIHMAPNACFGILKSVFKVEDRVVFFFIFFPGINEKVGHLLIDHREINGKQLFFEVLYE